MKEVGQDNESARIALHTVLGAFLAQAQGGSAAGGAAGGLVSSAGAQALTALLYPGVKGEELTGEQKELIANLITLAGAGAGGLVGGNLTGAGSGANTAKNEVENNALSDIIENKASGVTQEEKYQNARKQLEAAQEEFKEKYCAGLSAETCSARMEAHSQELLKGAGLFGTDFVPIVGDIKSFAEAQSALDYLAAAVGLVPVLGDGAGKIIKAAETALKKGDIAEASKLINKASDEIQVKWVDENASMSERARNYNDSASGARSNIETQKGQAPSIERVDADGKAKSVRFDGVDGNVMVDRKISVVTTQKAKNQALRQSEALKNNGMTGRWEVPNQAQANRAQKMFDELGIKNIEVKIVHE
ncbi:MULTISPECIES: VENN motif pre-toxin domain-containing protein [Brenneria]|uniref:VENN motif pre-toxin domain-containing protein n=1 Tax=Brenneria TaxID=71655 RepID=UPI001E5778C9|nr:MULTISPECIES: VENN motif pre-toxin domain-containing protein [Brenneria]